MQPAAAASASGPIDVFQECTQPGCGDFVGGGLDALDVHFRRKHMLGKRERAATAAEESISVEELMPETDSARDATANGDEATSFMDASSPTDGESYGRSPAETAKKRARPAEEVTRPAEEVTTPVSTKATPAVGYERPGPKSKKKRRPASSSDNRETFGNSVASTSAMDESTNTPKGSETPATKRPNLSFWFDKNLFRCSKCSKSSASAMKRRRHLEKSDECAGATFERAEFNKYRCELCYDADIMFDYPGIKEHARGIHNMSIAVRSIVNLFITR